MFRDEVHAPIHAADARRMTATRADRPCTAATWPGFALPVRWSGTWRRSSWCGSALFPPPRPGADRARVLIEDGLLRENMSPACGASWRASCRRRHRHSHRARHRQLPARPQAAGALDGVLALHPVGGDDHRRRHLVRHRRGVQDLPHHLHDDLHHHHQHGGRRVGAIAPNKIRAAQCARRPAAQIFSRGAAGDGALHPHRHAAGDGEFLHHHRRGGTDRRQRRARQDAVGRPDVHADRRHLRVAGDARPARLRHRPAVPLRASAPSPGSIRRRPDDRQRETSC